MLKSDYHVHSNYCDGADTIKDMANEAVSRGLTAIGFSTHSPLHPKYGMDYQIKDEKVDDYIADVLKVKEDLKDKITVLLGVECDYFSEIDHSRFDYVIGSVHQLEVKGEFPAVDHAESIMVNNVNKLYGGDYKAYVKDYYTLLKDVKNKTNCDFVGHFDVITKYNEGSKYFDETASWYLDLALETADVLIKQNAVFEINTGAIARGLRTRPYPSKIIYDYIAKNGGKFVLNSDCHYKRNLTYWFENIREYYKNVDAIFDFCDLVKQK